jgi:hypothetical protein
MRRKHQAVARMMVEHNLFLPFEMKSTCRCREQWCGLRHGRALCL